MYLLLLSQLLSLYSVRLSHISMSLGVRGALISICIYANRYIRRYIYLCTYIYAILILCCYSDRHAIVTIMTLLMSMSMIMSIKGYNIYCTLRVAYCVINCRKLHYNVGGCSCSTHVNMLTTLCVRVRLCRCMYACISTRNMKFSHTHTHIYI